MLKKPNIFETSWEKKITNEEFERDVTEYSLIYTRLIFKTY